MNKFNKFCEKYEVVLYQLVAALWFFVLYFTDAHVDSVLWAGVFWVAFAIFDCLRIYLKDKQNPQNNKGSKTSSKTDK